MRVAIVGELNKNGLSHRTYDAILKVKNLPLEDDRLEVDLILIDNINKNLDTLPCDRVIIYNQLTGANSIDKTVNVINHYYHGYKPSLVIVALNNHVDSIIPKVIVKINTHHRQSINGFLSCDHLLMGKSKRNLVVCKPIYGGNVMAHYSSEGAAILSFKQPVKSKEKLALKQPEIHYVEYKKHFDNHHINRIEMEFIEAEGLEDSDFVVVCGKGVGSKEEVEEISEWAASIGATVGGTKKVIDHGWLPIHQLIGQTGHTISPKTCLVIGASGATPFINGIIGSEKIIAINIDKDARIFDYADIGIVEDCRLITNVLITEFNKLGNK